MAMPDGPMLEWAGATSGKFKDKFHGGEVSRQQIPVPWNHGFSHGIAQNGLGRYFNDSAGLVPTEGRRAVPVAAGGQTLQWRSSRRTLSEPGSQHFERAEGIRQVESPPRKIFSIREKRHIRQVESK